MDLAVLTVFDDDTVSHALGHLGRAAAIAIDRMTFHFGHDWRGVWLTQTGSLRFMPLAHRHIG